MLRHGVLAVLGEVRIEHAGDGLSGQIHVRHAALLDNGVELVHEALAIGADPYSLREVVHRSGCLDVLGVHAGDDALQMSSRPMSHLDAVALILPIRGVPDEPFIAEGIFPSFSLDHVVLDVGHQVVEHFLVVGEAARGHHHGLAAELEVRPVGPVLGDDAGHLAIVLQDLQSPRVEEELRSCGFRLFAVVSLDLGLITLFRICGYDAGVELDGSDIGQQVRPCFACCGGSAMAQGGDVRIGQAVVVPIDVIAHVLAVPHDEPGVALVADHGHPILVVLDRVDIMVLVAFGDLVDKVRVDATALVARCHVRFFGLELEKGDPVTLLGQLSARGYARVPMAHHDRIVITGFACLRGVILRRPPRDCALRRAAVGYVLLIGLVAVRFSVRRARRQETRSYGSYASKRCAFDETTPIHPSLRSSQQLTRKMLPVGLPSSRAAR